MKLTRRQSAFTPRFLASPLFPDFGDLNATTQQLFEEVFGKNFPAQVEGWAPAVNMAETKDEYTVTAELPGLKPETSAATF
jgi:HSP20 family molecular chaperone IbpA